MSNFLSSPSGSSESVVKPTNRISLNPALWIQFIIFAIGFALLVYLIHGIGFYTVLNSIYGVGWGFLLIVALNGARHFLRALCIYLAFPRKHRKFKFRSVLYARLAGEAVSVVTFTGPFLGDATKAAILRKSVRLSRSGAAVIIDNAIYYVSVIAVILAGIALLSLNYSFSLAVKTALTVISLLAVFGLAGIILLFWFRVKPFSWLIKRFSGSWFVPRFILTRKSSIKELERNVYVMFSSRRGAFFSVLSLNFAAHFLSVVEVHTALKLLGNTSNLTVALIIESLTKVINLVFSFVPGMIGVYEGGNGVILKIVGYTTAIGVALALVRRGSILIWAIAGFAIMLWESATFNIRNRMRKMEDRPQTM